MIVLGKTYKTEEEFLEEHIMFPKTKDINYLLLYLQIGYTLYVRHENRINRLKLVDNNYLNKIQLYPLRRFIASNMADLKDIYCVSIDEANALLNGKDDYIGVVYVYYD